jgi:copper resistance protein B
MMALNASGLSDLDTGVRLRYEISRKFAPYIGLPMAGSMETPYSRQAGEITSDHRFVSGLRL